MQNRYTFFHGVVFVLLFLGTIVSEGFAQGKQSSGALEPFQIATTTQAAKFQVELKGFVRQSEVLQANTKTVGDILAKSDKHLRLTLPNPSGKAQFTLLLQREDVLSPDALVVAQTDEGAKLVDMHGKFVAYFGTVEGDSQSRVALTVSTLGLFANFNVHGTSYEYSPLQSSLKLSLAALMQSSSTNELGTEQPTMYVMYETKNILVHKHFECKNPQPTFTEEALKLGASLKEKFSAETHANDLECEVALEIGNHSFEKYRTVENTVAYYLNVMTNVSQIYIRDANTRTPVVYVRVWATANNPYRSLTKDAGVFLEALTKEWSQNQKNIPCDAVALCEFFDGNGSGIANLNAGSFYACGSEIPALSVNFCEDKFAPFTMYSDDVSLLAHELGHNFGSPHTHSCYWRAGNPIDTCNKLEANDTGSCGQDTTIGTKIIAGTIMSYCDVNGGEEGKSIYKMEFHPLCKDLITKAAREATCFQTRVVSPSPVTLLTPTNNSTNTPTVSNTFTWTALTGALAYQFQLSTSPNFDSTGIVLDSVGIVGTSVRISRPLREGTQYFWRVRFWNGALGGTWQNTGFSFTTMRSSSVRSVSNSSAKSVVSNVECFPNPVTRESTVRFTLLRSEKVRIELFNLLGQSAMLLAEQQYSSGEQTLLLNNALLSTGVYYLRVSAGDAATTIPLSIIR